jgi:hypothetical protein
MHELARVEHALRVASLSEHRRQSALMELLRRRRGKAPMAEAEEAAPDIAIIGRTTSDQAQSTAASEVPAEMAPPRAD